MEKKSDVYVKIIETILLIVSVFIVALPVFFCVGMISDTIKFDFPEHSLRGICIILVASVGIIGFIFLIIRAIAIWTGSVSKIITIGLILGLSDYLFFMIPVIPDLIHVKWQLMLAYTIPLIAVSLSLRNIYVHKKHKHVR